MAGALATLAAPAAPPAAVTGLQVGVGRADITPVTGGFKGGWSCTCAKIVGQQERLYAKRLVARHVRHRVHGHRRFLRRLRWRRVTDDLGMQIEWSSDAGGHDQAAWEVPLSATPGRYRFLITGKRYELASSPFTVSAGAILTPVLGSGGVALRYPQPFLLNDWTYRPPDAAGGRIAYLVGRRRVTVRSKGASFPIPKGASVTIPAGGAHDRYGNTNPQRDHGALSRGAAARAAVASARR